MARGTSGSSATRASIKNAATKNAMPPRSVITVWVEGLGGAPVAPPHDDDPDWDVDEEAPAPVQEVGQDAADQDARRSPAGGGGRPDADRRASLVLIGEGGGQ